MSAFEDEMRQAMASHDDEVWDALHTLPERQRAVLVLRYYLGVSDHEIAALLGCREATVRSLARRGLAAMRPLVAAASTEGGRA